MASVWKHPKSPFWTACFTDETGKQAKRSTKLEDRKLALKAAEAFEEAAKKAKGAELTRAAAVKMLNDLMERTHGEGLDTRSTREHFKDYVASLEARGTKDGTLKRYSPIFDGFLAHLGEARSNARIASVSAQEVESFRDAEMKAGKTAGTAGFALKVLNGVFEDARRKAVILSNPVQAVKPLASATSEERRPFTDAQVKALLSVADTEWQGMILFAYHTGIRLNDAANLSRQNIEGGKLLRFREAKTAHRKQRATERETVVVMASDLRDYLKSLTIPMKKDAPLFPSLYGKKSGSAGGLSNAFARLLDKAGIDRELGEARKGKGRRFSALSFHSLRHTMISRLANSDAPEAVTKAMSGHSTDEAHRRYVHLDTSAQARVVAKAPRIWKQASAAA
ncbi:MAG: tyrosine-type recombinase/integrase [Prosthecobacter sp.]|uniref:tyrosine-type recombinase/integrase n=1 Tax=Prosthecobacter sp. TaxID=1965333 RepID=UPI003BAFAE20